MDIASLFFGIGGFDLAADMMGWNTKVICEWNGFGQMIAKEYYKEVTIYGDITKTDFSIWRGKIDLLCGGFPCQPFSVAGEQLGTEDERHLWPEMCRAVREIQPRWVVGENVRGLVSWNGGVVFEQVCADMEAEGYEVQPFILPAAGVNAPHRRERIWFVARRWISSALIEANERNFGRKDKTISEDRVTSYCSNSRPESVQSGENGIYEPEFITNPTIIGSNKIREEIQPEIPNGNIVNGANGERDAANASSERLQKPSCGELGRVSKANGESEGRKPGGKDAEITGWNDFPTQPPVRSGNDGFSTELLRQCIREDSMGYLSEKEIDKIISEAGNRWREETIKASGNAIVPQVALQIFKAIESYESNHSLIGVK